MKKLFLMLLIGFFVGVAVGAHADDKLYQMQTTPFGKSQVCPQASDQMGQVIAKATESLQKERQRTSPQRSTK